MEVSRIARVGARPGLDMEDSVVGTSGLSVQAPTGVTTVACATSNVRNDVEISRFANGFTIAHEAGHLMGLPDAYNSKGTIPGYKGNIMAEYDKWGIRADQIKAILEFNLPSGP